LGFEGMANPVSILELQKRNRYNTQIFGNAALTFHLAEGLDLRTQFGVDNQRRDYKGYSSVLLNNISKPNGWAEMQYENVFYWQQENYLTYQKTIDKHRVNLMGDCLGKLEHHSIRNHVPKVLMMTSTNGIIWEWVEPHLLLIPIQTSGL